MRLTILAALAALVSVVGQAAHAHEIASHGLDIKHPWVRETPKGASVTAGYVEITNTGASADRLVGASLKSATQGELHESFVEEGISKMRRLADGLAIPPGATVQLAPGGNHIMFLGLKAQLAADGYIDGELIFEKAGTVPIEFYVEALGKPGPPGEGVKHEH